MAALWAQRLLRLAYIKDRHFVSIAYVGERILLNQARERMISMRNFLWDPYTFGNPERARDDKSPRLYPTPAEMLFRVGAMIVAALCVGMAVDYLIHALSR